VKISEYLKTLTQITAFRIAAIYFIISFFWILFSDIFVGKLSGSDTLMNDMQTYKGWFFISVSTILIYWLVNRNIRKKNKIIETFNHSELWYNKALENMPNTDVYLFDEKLTFILAQGRELSPHNTHTHPFLSKKISEINTDPQFREEARKLFKRIIQGESLREEIMFNGQWYELRGTLLEDSPQKNKTGIAVLININHIKKYEAELKISKEKAEENDRLKGRFLANMSHEIRTPLNGILGFSELISDTATTAEKRLEFASLITKNGNQLVNIIDDILEISKIETSQIKIHPTHFNINDLLLFVCENFALMIRDEKKNIEFRCNLPEDKANPGLFLDQLKLSQILSNLLRNAIQHTDKGSIEIGYKIKEHNKDRIQFYVKDSGKGIPKQAQEQIFDRFHQYYDDDSSCVKGAGLGLSIAKGFTKSMGGKISVDSEPGKGSTFTVDLPVQYKESNIV